ncbi:hypothetical protein CBS101457_006107 [Exobasidium rhododendri]|nr:hypothetical protein CBS101457_006107 [Exobasidium rhododendri]
MSSSTNTVDLGTHYYGSESGKAIAVSGKTKTVGDSDVVIEIYYSGLCGTDSHMRKANMALGHEGVGVISQVGKDVTNFKKGDRAGWGYVHDADMTCDYCLSGRDTLCDNRQMYGAADKDQASLGDRFVVKARFAHRIPDSIPLKYAGPLQCAGATVFGAIIQADIKPYQRVGVVGIGGLGHLALRYLKAWGCDVVAFSTSTNKKEEAMKLGANEFVVTKDNPEFEKTKPVDHLLIAADRQLPWAQYFKIMAKDGKVVPLSVSSEDIQGMPYMDIVAKQISILGSLVANRSIHRTMLEFSARHGIRPIIEELPMTEEGVNEALNRLEKGDVRYRFVLSNGKKDPLFD